MKFHQACPWKSHLYDLEKEHDKDGAVKFVLFKDDREGKWRVQVSLALAARLRVSIHFHCRHSAVVSMPH
jgi:uncharacterized UPF0160 family protein